MIYILMIIFSMFILIHYFERPIRSFTGLSCVYLFMLTFAQEMDVVFSIYFIFIMLALLPIQKVSLLTILYIGYVALYGVIGFFYQEVLNTASIVLTRLGFLVSGLFLCEKTKTISNDIESDFLFSIRIGTITEVILMGYLLAFGDLAKRLTINNHAIGGAISVGILPLICVLYFVNKQYWKQKKLFVYIIVHCIIVVVSGTRGYMVMAALTVIPLMLALVLEEEEHKRRWSLILGIGMIVYIILCFYFEHVWEYFLDAFRLNASIGYRVYENRFIKMIFTESTWWNKILGFGLGGRATNVDGYEAIASLAASGKHWMYSKLLTQTTVHNYWYTILFKQGIVGLVFCGFVLLRFWKELMEIFQVSKGIFWTLTLLFIGILVSLTFRISASCGVFETLVMLAITKIIGKNREIKMNEKHVSDRVRVK